jgi:hypothetical protein
MPRLGNFKYTAKLMTRTGRVRYVYGGSENLLPAVSRGGPIGTRYHQKSLFVVSRSAHPNQAESAWGSARFGAKGSPFAGALNRSRTAVILKQPLIKSVGRGPFGTVRTYHATPSSVRRYQRLVQRVKTMSGGRRPWSPQ